MNLHQPSSSLSAREDTPMRCSLMMSVVATWTGALHSASDLVAGPRVGRRTRQRARHDDDNDQCPASIFPCLINGRSLFPHLVRAHTGWMLVSSTCGNAVQCRLIMDSSWANMHSSCTDTVGVAGPVWAMTWSDRGVESVALQQQIKSIAALPTATNARS